MSEEQEKPDSLSTVDGVWRPEEWKNGKYLVTRTVLVGAGIAQRRILSSDAFGSSALIFESLKAAENAAKAENEKVAAQLVASLETPPSQEKTEEEND